MSAGEFTDAGNADRFVAEHGEHLRWDPVRHMFLRYDEGCWRHVSREEVMDLAIATAKAMLVSAGMTGIPIERAQSMAKWAERSLSQSKLKAMVELASGRLVVRADALDAHPSIINVANGTIDLRTGDLRAARATDLLTKRSAVSFDISAVCPTWDAFLVRVVPDPDTRAFLQRFAGYCLTGETNEQALIFLLGRGANGKSTFVSTLSYILGEYAKAGASGLLLAKANESHPTDEADIAGARLVTVQEIDQGRSWSERTIKHLTGGDAVKARFVHQDNFEFTPTSKFIVCANHKPTMRGQDEAIWRRMIVVPFDQRIPDAERDRELTAKLKAEASGILRWAVAGAVEWYRNGLGRPAVVATASASYRNEQDQIGRFIEDECELRADAWTRTTDLYNAYAAWCSTNGETQRTRDQFRDGLGERDGLEQRRLNKKGRGFDGVGLKVAGDVVRLPSTRAS